MAAIVVTSVQAEGGVVDALKAAGYSDLPCSRHLVRDPFFGFDEGGRLWKEDDKLRDQLSAASDLVVNVTGGTTAMQCVVDFLAHEAENRGARVRRVALVDRRTPDAQIAEPWSEGELVDLKSSSPAWRGSRWTAL